MLWGLRHTRSHHVFPNIDGSDIDIDKNPLLRLSPNHPWKPLHKFQYIYAPLAYALALSHSVFWGDWVYLISKDYEWMRKGVSKKTLWCSFLFFKLIHFTLILLLPWLFLSVSFAGIVFAYFTCGAISSLVFIVMLVGTHFFLEAEYPTAGEEGKLADSWATHNLKTSCDWNPDSPIARFFSGGANCHAAHHLFPNVCHIHYGKITPLIKSIADKHKVTYHHKSLLEMVKSHYLHLKKLSAP